jgi:hypothetical protein
MNLQQAVIYKSATRELIRNGERSSRTQKVEWNSITCNLTSIKIQDFYSNWASCTQRASDAYSNIHPSCSVGGARNVNTKKHVQAGHWTRAFKTLISEREWRTRTLVNVCRPSKQKPFSSAAQSGYKWIMRAHMVTCFLTDHLQNFSIDFNSISYSGSVFKAVWL